MKHSHQPPRQNLGALRYSEDYGEIEHDVSSAELDKFAERVNKELDADRKSG